MVAKLTYFVEFSHQKDVWWEVADRNPVFMNENIDIPKGLLCGSLRWKAVCTIQQEGGRIVETHEINDSPTFYWGVPLWSVQEARDYYNKHGLASAISTINDREKAGVTEFILHDEGEGELPLLVPVDGQHVAVEKERFGESGEYPTLDELCIFKNNPPIYVRGWQPHQVAPVTKVPIKIQQVEPKRRDTWMRSLWRLIRAKMKMH